MNFRFPLPTLAAMALLSVATIQPASALPINASGSFSLAAQQGQVLVRPGPGHGGPQEHPLAPEPAGPAVRGAGEHRGQDGHEKEDQEQ